MTDTRSGIWAKARNRRLFAVTETTFGTQAKPSATDAFKAMSGGIETHVPNRIVRADNRASRSREGYIQGNTPPVPWSFDGYIVPSGTAGTPPDIHALLMAVMGTDSYTNTPATSDVYALTDTCQNRGSLSLYEAYPACSPTAKDCIMLRSLFGAVANTLGISGSGAEPPTISIGGVGATFVLTGRTDVNDAAPGSQTDVDVTNALQTPAGSLIAFYEEADGSTLVDDNTGAGHQVTAVSSNNITLADSTAAGVADNDIVAPWCPTETTVGDPIPGTQATMTVEGASVSPISYEFNLDNGDQAHDNEAGQSVMTGYHDGIRTLSGQFTFRAKASDVAIITRREGYANQTISLVLGSTAGSILTIAAEVELRFASPERGPDDTVVFACPFEGEATSLNAKDEFKLTFT